MTGVPAVPEVEHGATPAATAAGRHSFRFDGDANEYFRIWVVNLFLSVITLGVYSAWAKVRKKRYLYGNTWVAGANFDYHGNPVSILKGRAIAVAVFLAYTLLDDFFPKVAYVLLIGAIGVMPWLVLRTLQFNALNSSYRHLRFHFHGRYPEALAAMVPLAVWPMLGLVVALGGVTPDTASRARDMWLLAAPTLAFFAVYPLVVGSLRRYHLNHLAYGDARFSLEVPIGRFYAIYFKAAVLFMGASMLAGLTILMFPGGMGTALAVTYQAMYLLIGAATFAYTRSRIANLVFNAARVQGGVRFESTLSAKALGKMYFQNIVAIAATVGLAVPWAVIRTARYRAECLFLACDDDPAGALAGISRPVAAAGDEIADVFDVDVSL